MADTLTLEGELARRWIDELERSEKWQLPWITRAKRIILRYRQEKLNGTSETDTSDRRFAILWSNIQTLGPAVYARKPQAVVSRRFKDADPVGRYASEVIERSLNFSIDQYDFDDRMKQSRDDFLLLARGQVWIRYVPHQMPGEPTAPAEDGEQVTSNAEGVEQPSYAEVACDHLAFGDFGMTPCREWSEATYVWRRAYMSRKELKARFGAVMGKAVNEIPLDWNPKEESEPDHQERAKKAAIYEIWDKNTGTVYWVSKGYTTSVLDKKPDWLKLERFFPCPRPLMGTTPPDNYIPVPDFVYYQDQAEELDELTQRIGNLVDALRMVGVYDASNKTTLANMFVGSQNELIPVESMASLADKGGLKGIIEWMPIDMVAGTLTACFEARQRILDDIYQITGLSDIIRGESDPNETLGAQQIKTQWGSLRVRDRQKELARFARDILEIKAEIIATKFNVPTLKAMTDIKLLTAQEKQLAGQVQQIAQAMQQKGAPPEALEGLKAQLPPDAEQLMSKPTWEDVDALLKNDAVRAFRIDIETDSTIEPNESEEKQRRVEFITAMAQFLGAALPVLEKAPMAAPLISESMKFLARGFRVGREMEDVIEQVFDQVQQMPPQQEGQTGDPYAPQTAQLELQTEQVKQQGTLQAKQLEQQMQQERMPLEIAELQATQQAAQRDPNPQASFRQ